jgi:hypothetical protein
MTHPPPEYTYETCVSIRTFLAGFFTGIIVMAIIVGLKHVWGA